MINNRKNGVLVTHNSYSFGANTGGYTMKR